MKATDVIYELFERWVDPYRRAEGDPPKTALAFLWFFLRQARFAFFALLLLGGAVALVEAGLFYFVGRLVDLLDSSVQALGWQGLIERHGQELTFMLVVVLLVRYLVNWASALVEEQTISTGFYNLVRWQAYAHVSRQSVGFFQNDFAGSIATKTMQSGSSVGDFLTSVVQVVWFVGVYTIATMALVAQLDWRLALLVGVWIVVFGLMAYHFVPRMRKFSAATAEAGSALTGRIVDSFSNIQTLKLFGTSDDDNRYVRQGFNTFIEATKRMTRQVTRVRGAMAMLSGVMISAIAAMAVHLWAEGLVSVGGVAFTLALVLRLYNLLGRMMTQLNGLMRNFGTAQNSAELVGQPIGLLDAPDAKTLVVERGGIRFEDVSFHYGKGSGVIDGLNLSIAPGERVGLIGRSGAGKSTIVSLLLRFYDVENGRITVDGQDVRAVTQESLRANIGVVTQDTALLHRSVRANIAFGRPDASLEDVANAAELAEADEFIESLSDYQGRTGYDAYVGERGVKLSGGQRQRLAIARVLLKNAPILVLDEATSALDSEIEAAIQAQLEAVMAGKTVIAIAHRLSTIAAMDRLVVLDKGRIVEEGKHDELLSMNGHYAALWARQSGGFLAGDE